MKRLRKVITSTLIACSVLALNPIGASAEWKQDSIGWRYTEGSSWVTGEWRLIDGNWYLFNYKGYMWTGWVLYNKNWYYLDIDGKMAHDTKIGDYYLGSDGAWVKSTSDLPSWEKQHDTIGFQMNLRRVNGVLADRDQADLQAYWENQKEVDEKYRAKKKSEGTWTQLDAANYYNLYMTTYYKEIYEKKDYDSYEQMVNQLFKSSSSKTQHISIRIDGIDYFFNQDGSVLYCARIDNTHFTDKSGQLSKDQENGTKLYIDGKGNEEFVEPSWLIKEKNYKETQSSNTVSNDINTNNKTDTSKVLSSGMTLKQAKLKVDSTIAGIKALGETVENNMDYINKLCTSMGTTYDEIKSFQG